MGSLLASGRLHAPSMHWGDESAACTTEPQHGNNQTCHFSHYAGLTVSCIVQQVRDDERRASIFPLVENLAEMPLQEERRAGLQSAWV